ncbi:hypothetical protein HK096_001048, partial [Nowakowskiella sp. JEL0078]
ITWAALFLGLISAATAIDVTGGVLQTCNTLAYIHSDTCQEVLNAEFGKHLLTLWAIVGSSWILAGSWFLYFIVNLCRIKHPRSQHAREASGFSTATDTSQRGFLKKKSNEQFEVPMKKVTMHNTTHNRVESGPHLEMVDTFQIGEDMKDTRSDGWGQNFAVGSNVSNKWNAGTDHQIIQDHRTEPHVDEWGSNGWRKTTARMEGQGLWGSSKAASDESPFKDTYTKKPRSDTNPFE